MKKKKQVVKNIPQKEIVLPKNNIGLQRLIVFIFPILLYSWTITFDYTLDDALMITDNAFTKKGISGISEIFSNDAFVGFFGHKKSLVAGGRYRPLSHAMFAVEYEYFGLNSKVGHFFNILFYGFLSLIIFETLKVCFSKFKNTSKWYENIPFIATLLFMIYPIHTEVVSNIKGRDEIISLAGSMLALMLSIKYIEKKKVYLLMISFLVFMMAMFSKENAITFLAVIPLSLYFFTEAKVKDYIAVILPVFCATLIFIIARYNALGFFMSSSIQSEILNNPYIHSSKADEIATTLFTWLVYFKLMIFPYPLTHDYYPWHFQILSFSKPIVWLALLFVIAIVFIAFKFFGKKHIISYGILFFIISFSIQSNIIFNLGTFMNERFIFVSLLGFAIIVSYYITLLKKYDSKMPFYLLFIIFSAYSIRSFSRSLTWKDNFTLFTTDVKHSPNSAKINVSAAEALLKKAPTLKDTVDKIKMYQDAYKYATKAQQIHPSYYGAYDLGGNAAFFLADFNSSFENYKKCLALNSLAPSPLNNIFLIAKALEGKGKFDDAINVVKWLISFKPDSTLYKYELALLYENKQDIKSSIDLLNMIIEKDNSYINAYVKLGEIYGKHLKDINTSEKYLLKAIEIDSLDFSANENLGIVYGFKRDFEKSLFYFFRAKRIEPSNKKLYFNIAATYNIMGDKAKAEEYIKLAKEN